MRLFGAGFEDLPWWLTLIILVPLALYGLLFLMMPFSVFGLKARLEAVELQLGEVSDALRALDQPLARAHAQDIADPQERDLYRAPEPKAGSLFADTRLSPTTPDRPQRPPTTNRPGRTEPRF